MGSIVVLPLLAFGLHATRSSGEKSPAAATGERSEAVTDSTEEKIGELEFLGPIRSPGDFISDLSEAFEEGTSSGLVHLSTEKEERLFERMREASRSESGLNLGLFRVFVDEEELDGIRVYELRSDGGEKVHGMIRMEQIEERWHVVGVAPPPPVSGAQEHGSPAPSTPSMPNASR